jgi:hypothetical protein
MMARKLAQLELPCAVTDGVNWVFTVVRHGGQPQIWKAARSAMSVELDGTVRIDTNTAAFKNLCFFMWMCQVTCS